MKVTGIGQMLGKLVKYFGYKNTTRKYSNWLKPHTLLMLNNECVTTKIFKFLRKFSNPIGINAPLCMKLLAYITE